MKTAICKKCGEEKVLTSEFWHKRKETKYGFRRDCKVCVLEEKKEYYKKNCDVIIIKNKKYRKNKNKNKVKRKDYYIKNNGKVTSAICKICGEIKILTEEFWYKAKTCKHGFSGSCKVCTNERQSNNSRKTKKERAIKSKEHYENNKDRILIKQNKYLNSPSKFKPYKHKLFADEIKKSSDGLLLVRCKNSNCNKQFIPINNQVRQRIQAINGNIPGESHFYCCDECKKSCVLYRTQVKTLIKQDELNAGVYKDHIHEGFYTQSQLSIWSEEVKRQHNFICEICGQTNDLTAHHIKPKSEYPEEALDPSNGICLCKNCHYQYGHSQNGCKTGQLRKCKV